MENRKFVIFAGIFFILTFLISFLSFYTFYRFQYKPDYSKPKISPVSQPSNFPTQVLAAHASPKKVIGFLPFWTMSDVDVQSLNTTDIVYYFALIIKGDGNFDKQEPGYQKLRQLKKINRKFGLTLANMDQDDIVSSINSATNRKRLIDNTLKLIQENDFLTYDVNLDFEYIHSPSKNMVESYNALVTDLALELHNRGGTLSVATLSDAVWKSRLYDIQTISKVADYIIVMAYDFTRLNSIEAGPVAPLFGKERFEYDVYTTITDYISKSSSQKIYMGIPFYGYDWPVVNSQPNSFVLGISTSQPSVSTYKRTQETIRDNNVTVNFDDYSKSPWVSYFDKESKTWRQVWFENERSLGLKLDLVNQANLGGIAIWALGYEGNLSGNLSHPLWQIISEKLRK